MKKMARHLLIVAALMVVWELVHRSQLYPTASFPSVATVLHALWLGLATDDLAGRIGATLMAVLQGFGLGIMLACLAALLWRRPGWCAETMSTLHALFHPLPGVALLPLLILWFGVGRSVVLVMIVHSVLWPMALNLKAGLDATPLLHRQIAQVFSLSKRTFWLEVALPGALPHILSGLKTGWARAWRALIAAEMVFGALGDGGGLGTWLFEKRVFMDTPSLLAGLLVIVCLGILVEDLLFATLEKRTVRRWGMSR